MDRYRSIVKYKTAFYTFVLSTRLAMYLAGRTNPDEHRLVEQIMLQIGELFQIQDDYLDCYGDPGVIGKIGTDIRDGKCSWLVVAALERATDKQRQIIQHNYGNSGQLFSLLDNNNNKDVEDDVKSKTELEEHEAAIKRVYNELNIEQVYGDYERELLQKIIANINELNNNIMQGNINIKIPVEIFYEPLSHVCYRKK